MREAGCIYAQPLTRVRGEAQAPFAHLLTFSVEMFTIFTTDCTDIITMYLNFHVKSVLKAAAQNISKLDQNLEW